MRKIALLATCILLAAGCQQAQEPENQPAPTAAAASTGKGLEANAVVEAQQIGAAKVTFEPSVFEECAPPKFVVATISWDANPAGTKLVDVMMINADGTESLFATGGPNGSKQTGPWIGPKAVVVLRDHDSGEEVGRGIAGSKPCSS
ncbi:hypothetical protein [Lysobacter humi (ex Lee et al. 2017)]